MEIVHISGSCHDRDIITVEDEDKSIEYSVAGIDTTTPTDYDLEERWILDKWFDNNRDKITDLYARHCGASGERYFAHYTVDTFDIDTILKENK